MDRPFDRSVWSGRSDPEEGEGGTRWHEVVAPYSPHAQPGIVLIGFACDEGVRRNKGRVGAQGGPHAIRKALASKAWHGDVPVYDRGDVTCSNGDLAAAQRRLADGITSSLHEGHRVIVLGGGHEVAYGSYLGQAQHLSQRDPEGTPRLGVLNFDAHFDLRNNAVTNSSGTPFLQIAQDCERRGWPFHYGVLGICQDANTRSLFDRAQILGVTHVLDEDLTPWGLPGVQQMLGDFLRGIDALYVTFCLDVLPAAQAPGVSAPAARGVSLEIMETLLLQSITQAPCPVLVADIAELNPNHDLDQRTARVAARLVHLLTRALSANT